MKQKAFFLTFKGWETDFKIHVMNDLAFFNNFANILSNLTRDYFVSSRNAFVRSVFNFEEWNFVISVLNFSCFAFGTNLFKQSRLSYETLINLWRPFWCVKKIKHNLPRKDLCKHFSKHVFWVDSYAQVENEKIPNKLLFLKLTFL